MNVVVLWIDGFPTVDSAPVSRTQLEAAADAAGYEVTFAGTDEFAHALSEHPAAVITPYGSAFPRSLWNSFLQYLVDGGSWLNLGGSPLSRPCHRRLDGAWYVEPEQTSLMKCLLINQSVEVLAEGDHASDYRIEWQDSFCADPDAALPAATRAWALQPRFTDTRDVDSEGGTSGTRDAVLRTQCYFVSKERRVAAPIVRIDRLHGRFAGGTWVLLNADLVSEPDASLVGRLLTLAVSGPNELDVHPSFGCYYEGEQPSLSIRVKAHRLRGQATLRVVVRRDNEALQVVTRYVELRSAPVIIQMPLTLLPAVRAGLYRVDAQIVGTGARVLARTETGFWGYDDALIRSGKPLVPTRDYFERDGKSYPLTGTTYMAGDVHRKFLFEPNAAVWDDDFAAMRAAGVNIVRTGLWTAFRRAMLDPGVVDEGVLRAFAAFLLTARKYDIPVIFNFFAFVPEEWGGCNPYLDPRSIDAQSELVAAFTERFAHVPDLVWDLINEPSFSSPAHVWRTRPNYDAFERTAWQTWLADRASDFNAEERAALDPGDVWRSRWRLSPDAPLDLPQLADFADAGIFQGTHPLRVLDYRLFAQEMFNRWVRTLTDVIRANGASGQLVTVGQDEGGMGERPNTHFFADVVDFTTNHSWWQNDDLLWDSVMTKTPSKPNVIQETGIMFLENIDGGYRRTPRQAALLLSRKFALSVACGCAGAIQWLWNTNVYMDSDNEVGIGFLRADGTEKPELEVFRGFARLLAANSHRMRQRVREEVCMVVPHSATFSVRDTADAATRRCVRTMEYEYGVRVRSVSEYRPDGIDDAKLVIVPSPMVLCDACWAKLEECARNGATVVVTGPTDRDPYWRTVERIGALGVDLAVSPVFGTEAFAGAAGESHAVRFSRSAQDRLEKQTVSNAPGAVTNLPHGAGRFLLCALPLELAENAAENLLYSTLEGFTQRAHAGILHRIEPHASDLLHVIVNETSCDHVVPDLGDLSIPAGGAALAFTTPDGDVIDVWSSAESNRK